MKTSIQIPVRLYFLAFGLLFGTALFSQNTTLYAKIKGAKQGEIKGDVVEKGREGLIRVLSYAHEIVSPRDVASGMATSKRQHKPLVITKEIDKASPLLYTVLNTGENLPEVTLTFYRPGMKGAAGGATDQYFTIKLTNANISGIKVRTEDKGQPLEEISFTYQKITWTYTDGGVTSEDSWSAQN